MFKKSFFSIFYFLTAALIYLTFSNSVLANGIISKNYFNTLGVPLTEINQGENYKITVAYTNLGSTIEETSIVNFIGPNQTYVPNSLQLPKYWTLGPDTDLAPASTNPHFEVIGAAGPVNGVGKLGPNTAVADTKIHASIKSIATGAAGGGDGYVPIIYENPAKTKSRICEIYHHDHGMPPNEFGARINCQDFTTGDQLPGYPRLMSDDIPTNAMTWNYVTGRDADIVLRGSKVYAAAVKSNFVAGILCYDIQLDAPCSPSFIPLSQAGADVGLIYATGLTGVYQYQDYMYMADYSVIGTGGNKPRIYCWNIATNAYCNGFDDNGYVVDYATPEFITLNVMSNHVILADSAGTAGSLACMDIGAGGALTNCANFPKTTNRNVSPVQYLDNAGNEIGFCVLNFVANNPPLCYDFVGNVLTPLPFMDPANFAYSGSSLKLDTKVYYPTFKNAVYCWDFSLSDTPQGGYCPDFKDNGDATHPPIPGLRRWKYPNFGETTDGIVPDPWEYAMSQYEGCIYGLGDTGTLWTFEPKNAKAPCIRHIGTTNVSSIQSSSCSATAPVNNVTKYGWIYPKDEVYPVGLTSMKLTVFSDEAMTIPIT